jgi:hypothetical protein
VKVGVNHQRAATVSVNDEGTIPTSNQRAREITPMGVSAQLPAPNGIHSKNLDEQFREHAAIIAISANRLVKLTRK